MPAPQAAGTVPAVNTQSMRAPENIRHVPNKGAARKTVYATLPRGVLKNSNGAGAFASRPMGSQSLVAYPSHTMSYRQDTRRQGAYPNYYQAPIQQRPTHMYMDNNVSDIDSAENSGFEDNGRRGRGNPTRKAPMTSNLLSEAQSIVYLKVQNAWPTLTAQDCTDIARKFNSVEEYDNYVNAAMVREGSKPTAGSIESSPAKQSLNHIPLTGDQREIY